MAQAGTSYVGLFRILPTPGIENFTSGNVYASLGEIMQLPYADSILEDIGDSNIDLTSVTTPLVIDLLTMDNTQTLQGLEGVAIPAKVWGDTFSVSTDVAHADIVLTHPFASTSSSVLWDSYYDSMDKNTATEKWHGKVSPSYSDITIGTAPYEKTFKVVSVVSNTSLITDHFPSKDLNETILHRLYTKSYVMNYNLGHKNGGTLVKASEIGRELLSHTDRNFVESVNQGWHGLNNLAELDHTDASTGGDFFRVEAPINTSPGTDNTGHAFEYVPAQSWDVTYGGHVKIGTKIKISMRVTQLSGYEGDTMCLLAFSGTNPSNSNDLVIFNADGLIEIVHTWQGPLTGISNNNAAIVFKAVATSPCYVDISEVSIRPYKEYDFTGDKFIDAAGNDYTIATVDPDQNGTTNKIRITWDNSMPVPTASGGDWTIINPDDEVEA